PTGRRMTYRPTSEPGRSSSSSCAAGGGRGIVGPLTPGVPVSSSARRRQVVHPARWASTSERDSGAGSPHRYSTSAAVVRHSTARSCHTVPSEEERGQPERLRHERGGKRGQIAPLLRERRRARRHRRLAGGPDRRFLGVSNATTPVSSTRIAQAPGCLSPTSADAAVAVRPATTRPPLGGATTALRSSSSEPP